jgi:hypothetical protein
MTLNADAGPAQAGATYTAWPLSELPEWMLADAPGQAAWLVVREPGDAIGWIQAPCPCPAADCTLAAQFVRLVAAAHGQVSLQPGTALVIYPKGAAAVAFPRPGANGGAFRRECLGRHLISRVQLSSTLAMWSGGTADAEPVNVAATSLARQHGFIWRRLHGPVMLCRAGGEAGWDLTAWQLVRLLTLPITLPRDQPALGGAGVPGGR